MNDNGQSYFFQTQSDTLFVNDDTNTVGVNVEVTPYDLEVKDTVRTSNLLADNVSACNLLQGLTINAQSNLCWGGHSLYEPYPQDQTDWDDLIPFTGDDEGMIHHSWIRKPLSGKDVLTDLWNLADAGFDVAETIADAIQFFQGASNALTQGAINAIQELLDNALENSNQSLSINWANLRDKPIARSGYKVGMNGDLMFSSNAKLGVLNSGFITDQWNNLQFVGNNPTGATLIDFGNRQAYFKDITLSNNEGRNTLYTVDEIVTDSNFKIGDIRFYQSNINNSASNISINGVQMLENDLTLSVVKADQMNAFSYYDPTGTGASLGFFGSETTLRHIRTPLASNIADRVYLTLRLKDSEMSFEKLSACNTKTILFQVNSNGEFYTYSNLRTNAPFTIRAIANSIDDYPREGLTFLTENNFRYIRRRVVFGSNEDTISASFSSNGLLLGERASLFGKVESVILNPLLSNAITKYPRLEYSFSNGLTYGYGFSNHPLNGDFDIFKVSYKGEITTLNHQNFLMKQILNSNADLTTNLLVNDRISLSSNGLTISNLAVNSNGSMTFANMPFLTEAGALIRRAFADPASNQGFSVSPTGFVNVNATNFQITNEGQLSTRMPITASNINTSNLTATSNLVALSNMTIGTTTPTERLTLQGGNIAIRNATVNNANGHNHGGIVWYGLNRTTGNASAKILSASTAWDDAGDLRFITSDGADDGFERMCIAQAGNVGIGTTSPSTLLDVNGRTTLRTDVSLMSNNSTWGNSAGRQLYMRYSTNGTQDASYIQSIDRSVGTYYNMALEGSNIALGGLNSLTNPQVYIQTTLGRVGINTTNPVYNLDVNSNFNATTINEFGVPLINKYALSNALSNVSSNLTTFSNWSSCNFVGLSNAFSNTQSNFATYSNNIQASISSLSNWTDATFRKKSVNVPWSEISGKPNFTSDSNGDALSIGGLVLGSAGLLFGGTALLNQNGQLTSALQNVAGSLKLNPSGYSRFDDGIQLLDKISIDPSGAISAVTGSFKYSQFTDAVKVGLLSLTLSNDQIIWTSNTTSNMVLSSNALVVRNNQPFTFSNANMLFTCNVGIGTNTPSHRLDVSGAVRTTSNALINNNLLIGEMGFGVNYQGICHSSLSNTSLLNYGFIQGANGDTFLNGGSNSRIYLRLGNTDQAHINSNGLGIGTINPLSRLSIQNGNITITNAVANNSNGHNHGGIAWYGLNRGLGNASAKIISLADGWDDGGNLTFITSSGADDGFERMRITETGNVGIGTSNPSYLLDVIGSANASNIFENGVALTTKYVLSNTMSNYAQLTQSVFSSNTAVWGSNNSSNLTPLTTVNTHSNAVWTQLSSTSNVAYTDRNWTKNGSVVFTNSNVGIGTNAPLARLHTLSPAGNNIILARFQGGGGAGNAYHIDLATYVGTTGLPTSRMTLLDDNFSSHIIFSSKNTGADANPLVERMRIQPTGNVGIGTSSPSYRLDVNGDANATNVREGGVLLSSKYALSNTLSNYTPLQVGVFNSNTSVWSSNTSVWSSNTSSSLSNAYYSSSNTIFGDRYWTFIDNKVLTLSNVSVSQSNFLEFGTGITKEENAGRIAYQRFSNGLDIIGAGSNVGELRRVRIWDILDVGGGIVRGQNGSGIRIGDMGLGSNNVAISHNALSNTTNTYALYQTSLGETHLNSASGRKLFFKINNATAMAVNSNGNIGIGTASPSNRLHIANGNFMLDNNGTVLGISPGTTLELPANISRSAVYYEVQSTAFTGEPADKRLHVFDNSVSVLYTLSASSKNFKIPHPVNSNKTLIHASVEAPQLDLIYSGVVKLNNGKAIVNIDVDSCPHSPMTEGTFEALTRNPRIYLQNNDGFTAVKGKVVGGTIEIEAQNKGCDDNINWLIIAERKDERMMNSSTTNENGHLITEY